MDDPIQVITRALCLSSYERCEEMTRPFAESVVKALDNSGFVIVPKAQIAKLKADTLELFQMVAQFTTDA